MKPQSNIPLTYPKKESASNMKNTKKTILALVSAILIGGIFYGFHFVASGENYLAHRTVRRSLVDHPEFIPTERTVRVGSMGMETLIADFYWLSAIQYIGSNAVSAEYKEYLGVMLNLVTDLSPHFTYPYNIGMLLIPDVNQRYETLTADDEKRHIAEALALGKKGIEKNCDGAKIAKISQTFDLQKLYSDESLMEPCTDPMIPYYLGYVAYWNDNDPVTASLWFRVAGTHAAAPRGARLMSAIMQGKTGNREKAIIMFLSLAESVDNKPDSTCRKVVGELRNLLAPAFDQGAKLTPSFLKQIEQVRQNAKKEL